MNTGDGPGRIFNRGRREMAGLKVAQGPLLFTKTSKPRKPGQSLRQRRIVVTLNYDTKHQVLASPRGAPHRRGPKASGSTRSSLTFCRAPPQPGGVAHRSHPPISNLEFVKTSGSRAGEVS